MGLRAFFVILSCVTACLGLQKESASSLRLPADARPVAYRAELRLVPGQDDFTGTIEIDLSVKGPASTLKLHALELTFKDVTIRAGERQQAATWDKDNDGRPRAENDIVTLRFDPPIPAGRATLNLEYAGKISRTLTDGLFQQQEAGDWYVFTKFEPVTARRAFPCFDEPGFKTPWQLTLRVPSGLQAFSNGPLESQTAGQDGTAVFRFRRTQPLTSYLVAFAIGPFETVNTPPIGRKKVPGRIIVPKGRAAEADAAARATPRLIEAIEEYFDIPYPYEKLDQIVVPLTTSWGAIENAGLIGYGPFLLSKPETETSGREQSRLTTMIHEMIHQWLGNYVTTAWWDDLWLQEGMTSWLTTKLVDRLRPDWKVAVSPTGNGPMYADSLVSARKIRQPIVAPGDIGGAFDGITYSKGAAVLTMFERYTGEQRFHQAVRAHLREHAWGNATNADFLRTLDRVAGRELSGAVSTFLDQNGVPLISADVRETGGQVTLQLRQERYLPVGTQSDEKRLWKIPICYKWSQKGSVRQNCVMLEAEEQTFALGPSPVPDWVYVNEDATSYCRVRYEDTWASRLLEHGAPALKLRERIALIQNVQALAVGGRIPPRQAFPVAQKFFESEERQISTSALRIAGSFAQILPPEKDQAWAAFLRNWLGPSARKLGWQNRTGDSDDVKAIRQAIVPMVTIDGRDPELGQEAIRLARLWLEDFKAIDRDMSGLILIAAARNGDRALFDDFVAALRKAQSTEDRTTLAMVIGAFRDPEIERSALSLLLKDSPVDPRELTSLLSGQWRDTKPVVWDFIRQNFDELNARLPGARGIPYGASLAGFGGGFCDDCRRKEVEDFFKPRIENLSGGARNLARALENIDICIAKRQVLLPGLLEFLTKYE